MSDQKIAVVTGATSGIGRATARLLADKGIPVIINGRRQERLEQLMAEFNNENVSSVFGFCGDASTAGLVNNLFHFAKQQHNLQPNTFILCAGLGLPGSILQSDHEKWAHLLEVNYLGVLHQLKECATIFLAQAEQEKCQFVKDIVVIGSTIGRQVSAFNPVYGSTKFAVHSLVEALRQEVCSKNIRVTLIEPGFVKTEFQEVAGYNQTWVNSIEQDLGQLLAPEDIAHTIDFVIHQPKHVHLDDIRIRPTRQKA